MTLLVASGIGGVATGHNPVNLVHQGATNLTRSTTTEAATMTPPSEALAKSVLTPAVTKQLVDQSNGIGPGRLSLMAISPI